jgi:hypothetical protein
MGQLRRFPDFNVGATAFAAHHGSMVLIHAPVGVWPAYRILTVYHLSSHALSPTDTAALGADPVEMA